MEDVTRTPGTKALPRQLVDNHLAAANDDAREASWLNCSLDSPASLGGGLDSQPIDKAMF